MIPALLLHNFDTTSWHVKWFLFFIFGLKTGFISPPAVLSLSLSLSLSLYATSVHNHRRSLVFPFLVLLHRSSVSSVRNRHPPSLSLPRSLAHQSSPSLLTASLSAVGHPPSSHPSPEFCLQWIWLPDLSPVMLK
jgi:hypothetical protein